MNDNQAQTNFYASKKLLASASDNNAMVPYQGGQQSSGAINPFGSNKVKMYSSDYYQHLLEQFDRTFLSKLVDLHNTLFSDYINLDDLDDILEFFKDYQKHLEDNYFKSLLFPEKYKNVRIPTKFPIPSFSFFQKSSFTITPNNNLVWYLQWCPQTLLDSSYAVANTGNLLLNNATALNGTTADVTAADYTPITVDRLQTTNLIQAFRLVSASIIVSYIGSIDAHSGVLGGAMDISFYDSLQPDTASSQFSVIDDKMWSLNSNPYEGLRLIYFPKDYSDFNFIRTNIGTQANNSSTCMRMLVYGQNLPAGSSVRVDLYRNFEAIPNPAIADFVSLDFNKVQASGLTSQNEPALEAGRAIVENNLPVTKNTREDEQKLLGVLPTLPYQGPSPQYKPLPRKTRLDDSMQEDYKEKPKGSVWDIAWGLGKEIIGGPIGNVLSYIPGIGTFVQGARDIGKTIGNVWDMANTGIKLIGNK
jgi:hypothetical protein